jgi:pSer/pThr/pTyr-binding forkhead associated (FHA) protein
MTPQTLLSSSIGELTERFDPIECLDERVRSQAASIDPQVPGAYVEVQGSDRSLLIPLGDDAIHIGRGLHAELRLDEKSVSRRHAILVPGPDGARILDDRSSNGTFVNGQRIPQADLRSGDVIVLGRVTLRYLEV